VLRNGGNLLTPEEASFWRQLVPAENVSLHAETPRNQPRELAYQGFAYTAVEKGNTEHGP